MCSRTCRRFFNFTSFQEFPFRSFVRLPDWWLFGFCYHMFGEGSGLLASTTGLNDKGNPVRNPVSEGGGVRVDGVVENADGSFTPQTAYVDANYYYQGRKSLIWEDYVYDASYVKMRELSIG